MKYNFRIEDGKLEKIYNMLHERLLKKRIWVYGIGRKGKRVMQMLNSLNICIAGILVSSRNENIDAYMGVSVSECLSVKLDENDLVIVAINGEAQNEVVDVLKMRHVKYLIWNSDVLCNLWREREYEFHNRSMGRHKLCIVLCGYKEYLWKNVFERLKNNLPGDVEVCLCSAGKYLDSLDIIAKDNNWSYLCTKNNSVSMVQNLCISLHPNAEWIYKMDEDIFVTKYSFENLVNTAYEIFRSDMYELGLVSPLITLNANCYRILLEKYGVLNKFENRFGKAMLGGNPDRVIEKEPEAVKFMWGNDMPHLDIIAEDIRNERGYEICSTRLSIGFILFRRELWEDMQGFIVYGNMDLGIDEEDINAFCINNSRIIAISKNAVAGHFAFGKQTESMKAFYSTHGERF